VANVTTNQWCTIPEMDRRTSTSEVAAMRHPVQPSQKRTAAGACRSHKWTLRQTKNYSAFSSKTLLEILGVKTALTLYANASNANHFIAVNHQETENCRDMTVGSPMERAGIDLTGPWLKSHNNTFILTSIDHFTKWADAVPIPNKEAHTVAKALVEKIFTQVGCVLQLVSDQGKEFDNQVMTEICHRLHIDKTRTTPYKPSTNASVERMHRKMHSIFATMIDNYQHNGSELLPFVMAAYRSVPHDTTGFSPNFLHVGREVRAPIDLILEMPNSDGQIPMEYADVVAERLRQAYTLVREQLGVQAERRKKYYDTKLKPSSFLSRTV
jgi:transposase InsO family protein